MPKLALKPSETVSVRINSFSIRDEAIKVALHTERDLHTFTMYLSEASYLSRQLQKVVKQYRAQRAKSKKGQRD